MFYFEQRLGICRLDIIRNWQWGAARNWIEGAMELLRSLLEQDKRFQGFEGDRTQGDLASMVGTGGDVVELGRLVKCFLSRKISLRAHHSQTYENSGQCLNKFLPASVDPVKAQCLKRDPPG